MPPVETAARMPCALSGLKPLAAVKFEVWKFARASTKMVASGTATFHQVAALFAAASLRIPRKLMDVRNAISRIATIRPLVVSTPVFGSSHPCAKE